MTDTTWLDEAIIDSAKRAGLWTDEMSDELRKGEYTRLYLDIPSLKATILTKLEEAKIEGVRLGWEESGEGYNHEYTSLCYPGGRRFTDEEVFAKVLKDALGIEINKEATQ